MESQHEFDVEVGGYLSVESPIESDVQFNDAINVAIDVEFEHECKNPEFDIKNIERGKFDIKFQNIEKFEQNELEFKPEFELEFEFEFKQELELEFKFGFENKTSSKA